MKEYRGEIDLPAALAGILPHQRDFITRFERSVAYVGGQGSGKSVALCIDAIAFAVQDPNGFSMIGRLHIPALINSTMKTFLELIPDEYGEWKPSEKRYVFFNGHELVFLHLDISDPKTVGHIKSMNLSAAYVDEASEINEDTYYLIEGRVRRKTAPRHKVRLTSNPAGQDWLWRNFFDPQRKSALKGNIGIHASSFDNYHLDAKTLEHWKNTYPADWAQRYLYGSFADFSDLIYKEFSDRTHVWDCTRSHDIFGGSDPPLGWPVIVGMDIGGGEEGDPWAIPVIAVAPDGRLYQFAEVYGSDLRIRPIADQLHAHLAGRHLDGLAYDYAQRAAAQELEEHDLPGAPAIKEVRPGLFKVAQYMHIDPRLTHAFTGTPGSPRYFVSSACPNTIRELTAYKWAKDRSGNPKFEPAHEHSHMPDGIRYAIHTFRPLPEKDHIPAKWENPALDEMSRLYWYEAGKHERDGEEKGAGLLRFKRPRLANWRRPAVLRPPRVVG